MNPNMPYGQQIPIPPHQRRHDVPYGQPPPQMRPHPGYQHYYGQPMGTMMPQYQHYQQQWYPQYQPHMHQYHAGRHPYYQPPPPPPPPQMHQLQGPLVVGNSQQQMPPPQRAYQMPYPPAPAPVLSSASTPSAAQLETPPSRPVSAVSASNGPSDTSTSTPITPSKSLTSAAKEPLPEAIQLQEPFVPPIPWLSVDDQPFPPRAARRRRKVFRSALAAEPITYPLPEPIPDEIPEKDGTAMSELETKQELEQQAQFTPAQTPTPLPSDAVSDTLSTQPTTPLSTDPPVISAKSQQMPTQSKTSRAAIPVVPVVPVVPSSPSAIRRTERSSVVSAASKDDPAVTQPARRASQTTDTETDSQTQMASDVVTPPPAPKSWADLVRSKNAAAASTANSSATASVPIINGIAVSKTESLGEVLGEISVGEIPSKIAFLQPRGLVNTGNMCYMNSVLQVLIFCTPFYEFLDRIAKKAAYTFKSNTPLIDSMIMFMREYAPIDTATSVEQLRLRLKSEDFENYGDSLRPEYVYDTINKLPRFRDMRRGHQQDAQEFLGFLLEELHEECSYAMHRSGTSTSSGRSTPVGSTSNLSEVLDTETGWMEVGHKQKAAITRSSGTVAADSPVTGIFGGKLRSELKIAGNKLSVTLEPYQPLQLDIGSPLINNIVDALKGLTRAESMQGDFQSVRGNKTSATKQVFIETLPPVLILHLKRFQYDSSTKRAEKIWKKVGYPLELEIPKEVFPPSARNKYAAHGGLPRYRLTGVIYHHGKNANGGHYTADIRRQDGQEWIRIDDTLIRRIRSEDVALGGSEEDPKILAAALERHKKQGTATGNRFEQIDADEEEDDDPDKVWSQVNGHSRSKSTMSAIINGTSTPSKDASAPQTPRHKDSIKDNKVAYLLFYQRIAS